MESKRILLKPKEIAEIFGIFEGTLANLRWAKRGPRYYKKPGGRGVYYLREDVARWVLSNPVATLDSYAEAPERSKS
jgi:hypothetical protein